MLTWKDIWYILRTVLHWWWVIVLATILSSGTAFYLSQQEVRFYVAHTTLMVGNTFESTLPDQNQLVIGSSLARFYGELARREPILKPVQESLQLPFPWQIISDRMLMTNVIPNANLLEIYVTNSNPERAAVIANAIGERLMAYSPTSKEKIQAEQEAIEQRLRDTDAKILDLKTKIAELSIQQRAATSASDLAEINQKLTQLNASLGQEETSYQSLLNYKNNSIVNSLSVFELAAPPLQPLPSKRILMIGMAGLAGMLLALIAIFILERLDNRWQGKRDLEARFSVANLGAIPDGPSLINAPQPFAAGRLQAVHDVQTNILLAAAERGTRTLLISSPHSSESRTRLTVDLADLFARSGHKVLIVDADFTHSSLTRMLAPHDARAWTMMSSNEHNDIWAHLRPTPISNVALLPGRAGENGVPAMIPSLRWQEMVHYLLNTADVILFDGPAALNGPDAALLAPHVDGVVLALDPTKDSREDVNKSKTRLLHQKGAQLLGAVTFTPPPAQFRSGADLQQLYGPNIPELAPASVESGTLVNNNTPAPTSAGPIITPAPVVLEETIEQEQLEVISVDSLQNTAMPPQGADLRRSRRAARAANRTSNNPGERSS